MEPQFESKKVTKSLVLDDDVWAWLEAEAKRTDQSVSRLVRQIISEYQAARKRQEEGWKNVA